MGEGKLPKQLLFFIQVFEASSGSKQLRSWIMNVFEANAGSKQSLLSHTRFFRQTLDQTIALGYAGSSLAQVRGVCSVTGGYKRGVGEHVLENRGNGRECTA
jgi:hypothetical protein